MRRKRNGLIKSVHCICGTGGREGRQGTVIGNNECRRHSEGRYFHALIHYRPVEGDC